MNLGIVLEKGGEVKVPPHLMNGGVGFKVQMADSYSEVSWIASGFAVS